MAGLDTAVMDAMRDAGVERLRFKTVSGGARVTAAAKDAPWVEARELLPRSASQLAAVEELFRLGGHERLDLVFREEIGLRFFCAVHSTRLGPGAGGLRRVDLVVPEIEVVQTVLNLSRAMSYKAAAAGLERGGSKLLVHNPGIADYDREAWLSCLVEEIELSGTITGPDSGYPAGVYLDLAERTPLVTGVRGGGTSRSAAHGVFLAVRASAAALGIPLPECRIAIQGLGSLGLPLAEELVREGAALIATDRDHRRIDALVSGLGPDERRKVGVVAPYQILDEPCDILAPCATANVVTSENVRALKCRALCGGANNQLAARSLEEERSLARTLMERSILYVPDWLASAGGAIHGVMEYEARDAFDPRHARARIGRLCGWAVDEILEQSKKTGLPALEIAIERFLGPLLG